MGMAYETFERYRGLIFLGTPILVVCCVTIAGCELVTGATAAVKVLSRYCNARLYLELGTIPQYSWRFGGNGSCKGMLS